MRRTILVLGAVMAVLMFAMVGAGAALTDTVFSTSDSPTTKGDCKNGGWKAFENPDGSPMFKNQGQCIKAVSTAPPPPAGSLDTSFGNNGIAVYEPGDNDGDLNTIRQVHRLPNGQYLALSNAWITNSQGQRDTHPVLARFQSNGALDTSFGNNGKVVLPVQGYDDAGAFGPDGRLVLGAVTTPNPNPDPSDVPWELHVWRFNTDGTPDETFGPNGHRSHRYEWNQPGYAPLRQAVVAPNGDIIFGSTGRFYNGDPNNLETDIILSKVFADGSLDRINRSDMNGVSDQFIGLALASNDKVLVTGGTASGEGQNVVVQRYNYTDLSSDTTFDGDGFKVIDAGGSFGDAGLTVNEQSDGKVLITADRYGIGDTGAVVIRLNANGTLDTSYGQNGFASLDLPGQGWVQLIASQLDASNRLVATGRGSAVAGETSDVLVARFLPDGTLDATFGDNGSVQTSVGDHVDIGLDVLLDPDGRIVVAGHRSAGNGAYSDAVMLRYHD
jgi:uncharacterized delta-60 repeat protein